jgi:hypothetical protein
MLAMGGDMKLFLAGTCFFFSTLSWAHVTDGSQLWSLPAGTQATLKTKEDINLLPNTDVTELGTIEDDDDQDGVPNSLDWCPQTPRGNNVWKSEDVGNKKTTHTSVGCAGGTVKELWLVESKSTPSGDSTSCRLEHDSSSDDRTLEKSNILTLESAKREERVDKDDYLQTKRPVAHLYFKTAGSSHIEMACRGWHTYTDTAADGTYINRGYSTFPLIKHGRHFLQMAPFPKAKVIP